MKTRKDSRTERVQTRLSKAELAIAERNAKRRRARTFSDYMRVQLLEGNSECPDYETLRTFINAMIAATAAIHAFTPGDDREETLKLANDAFRMVTSWKIKP